MKKILIRFDDICPTMNWEQWDRAESLLNKFNVKPLIGVIPDCKDPDLMIDEARPDFWDWVRQKQQCGYAIAMHGVNHVFCSPHHGILNYRMNSEFAGLSYEEQLHKIKQGREILESHGVKTDIFFAPAHSYDENTVKALAACGFKYVSDGKSSKAYVWHGVKFLPCRNSGALFSAKGEYSTSIYHAHEWAIPNKGDASKVLKSLLERNYNNVVSFDAYKDQPIGNVHGQLLVERIYTWTQFKIWPKIKKIVRR